MRGGRVPSRARNNIRVEREGTFLERLEKEINFDFFFLPIRMLSKIVRDLSLARDTLVF